MKPAKFAESALGLTKSPLGTIALFIVLVYGFASLVVGFGSGLSEHVVPLIYFLVFGSVSLASFGLWQSATTSFMDLPISISRLEVKQFLMSKVGTRGKQGRRRPSR